ncbi:hypothetical protein [Luteimonas sp. FCS-9]|uniref:hypothetical protein n=1 Tax=Luteimonas sp. FCS-9 TaxID=1547516 RepID=UPI00063EA439|nr:hypothetical protein [Luteimonas sp. FCS-9]KLI99459.1 hypothetical protein WQ56_12505 [Luteimonas sp. FCS-9]
MRILFFALVGAVIGFAGINLMAYLARGKNNPFDRREFPGGADALARIDAWAAANGYRRQADQDGRRVYRKGLNLLTSPMYLEVEPHGDRIATRSFVRVDGLILKGDLALAADGPLAKVPRVNAQKAHDRLFAELGRPTLP